MNTRSIAALFIATVSISNVFASGEESTTSTSETIRPAVANPPGLMVQMAVDNIEDACVAFIRMPLTGSTKKLTILPLQDGQLATSPANHVPFMAQDVLVKKIKLIPSSQRQLKEIVFSGFSGFHQVLALSSMAFFEDIKLTLETGRKD